MAITSIQIRNYEYYVFSSRGSSDPASAVILLYEASNTRIASLFFAEDDQVMILRDTPKVGISWLTPTRISRSPSTC